MDHASIQRFGLALTILGATLHLQEVAQYPRVGLATGGGFFLILGTLVTVLPLVSESPVDDEPRADESPRSDD
jgi:hypothetical protein